MNHNNIMIINNIQQTGCYLYQRVIKCTLLNITRMQLYIVGCNVYSLDYYHIIILFIENHDDMQDYYGCFLTTDKKHTYTQTCLI